MKYVTLICARGGSKGLPGKNIKPLGGIPLIGRAINTAKKIARSSRIIVSTDSEEIAKVALKYGAEVPFERPKNLSLDDSPEWLVWRHAIEYMEEHMSEKVDALIVLPVTAPLRSVSDVESCVDLFESEETDAVITVSEAHRSPFFNMVMNDSVGNIGLIIQPKTSCFRRQDSPEVFDMTTVAYVVSTDLVKNFDGIFDGRVKSVNIPKSRSIDIDTPLDFKIAECLFLENRA